MPKERLDVNLVNKGLFDSREKARRAIMEGIVFVNGIREDKPGFQVHEDAEIEIKGNRLPYVSRGGLKLEKAINDFSINLNGKICLDIGASTEDLQTVCSKMAHRKYIQLMWDMASLHGNSGTMIGL